MRWNLILMKIRMKPVHEVTIDTVEVPLELIINMKVSLKLSPRANRLALKQLRGWLNS
jgi:hypothetical protein